MIQNNLRKILKWANPGDLFGPISFICVNPTVEMTPVNLDASDVRFIFTNTFIKLTRKSLEGAKLAPENTPMNQIPSVCGFKIVEA